MGCRRGRARRLRPGEGLRGLRARNLGPVLRRVRRVRHLGGGRRRCLRLGLLRRLEGRGRRWRLLGARGHRRLRGRRLGGLLVGHLLRLLRGRELELELGRGLVDAAWKRLRMRARRSRICCRRGRATYHLRRARRKPRARRMMTRRLYKPILLRPPLRLYHPIRRRRLPRGGGLRHRLRQCIRRRL